MPVETTTSANIEQAVPLPVRSQGHPRFCSLLSRSNVNRIWIWIGHSHPATAPAGRRSANKYVLTRICPVEHIVSMESVFQIIAEPNRRAILGLLLSSQQSVGEIERQLGMPQPAVSKHLRVLRDAGFVESTVDAQRRLYRLRPEPFQEVDAWLTQFRQFWSAHVDALERHLDRMEQSTDRATDRVMDRTIPTKGKTRRTRRGANRERHT